MTRAIISVLCLLASLSAQTTTIGPGCPGSCGMAPDLIEATAPWLGKDYCVQVYTNCACKDAFAAQVLWIGNSKAKGAGVELKLPWTTGCSRYFKTSFKMGVAMQQNAKWCLSLPPDAVFHGVKIMLQAIVARVDCAGNREYLTTRTIEVVVKMRTW